MLERLIERVSLLEGKSDLEQNLKHFVTVWMLKELGYEELLFDFEHPLCRDSKNNKHADIFIPVEPGKAMFVETKKYSKDLNEEDIIQLAEYITLSHEIAWGILTNGRQIFLLNNSIDIYGKEQKNVLDKLVLRVEYNPSTGQFKNGDYIKYFSKENIYDTHVTNYFKAVAQFLAKHSLSKASEEKYQNTLWQFFDYYISKGNKYTIYGAREYAPLEEIKDRDFIEFLKNFKSTTRKASGKVPLAKCSHIFTMYDVMEKNGFISINTMKDVRKRAKVEVEYDESNQEDDSKKILTTKNIEIIMNKLKNKPYKIVIFILAAYYGFSRDNIAKFLAEPWSAVDFDKHIFILGTKKYPLVGVMENNLIHMRENYKKRGIKKPSSIYVFKKNGVYTSVGTDTINAVFDEIKKYKEEGVNWRLFNPQNTRSAAIYNMLCAGCSIEEIAYITDSALIQLVKYLPDDIVEKNGEKEWKSKNGGRDKHPFKEIFD